MTCSTAEKTGSKLGPMTQPYLPLAVALPRAIEEIAGLGADRSIHSLRILKAKSDSPKLTVWSLKS